MTRCIRPRRSVLYMPAANARALAKARSLPVDGLIMDLEDAVAPDAKAQARQQAVEALRDGDYGYRERILRINGLDTPWGAADLDAAAVSGADAVLLPKIDSATQLHEAAARLASAGAPAGQALWVMAETPAGLLNLPGILAAHPRLEVVVMGTSDLAKALRLPDDPHRTGLLPALAGAVLAARAAGLDILDGVQVDLADSSAFRAACEQGRALGFDGKTLVHPSQIEAANQVFGVSAAALEEARAVVAAWDAAAAAGRGIAVLRGRMIESLHADAARRLIALADTLAQR